jgi:hypothetical protein
MSLFDAYSVLHIENSTESAFPWLSHCGPKTASKTSMTRSQGLQSIGVHSSHARSRALPIQQTRGCWVSLVGFGIS